MILLKLHLLVTPQATHGGGGENSHEGGGEGELTLVEEGHLMWGEEGQLMWGEEGQLAWGRENSPGGGRRENRQKVNQDQLISKCNQFWNIIGKNNISSCVHIIGIPHFVLHSFDSEVHSSQPQKHQVVPKQKEKKNIKVSIQ